MKLRNAGFAPIIVVLLLILVGAGAYLLGVQRRFIQKPSPSPAPTPTSDPTANWKTYISSDMTFKYPSNWTISGFVITSDTKKISIYIAPKDSTLMNECMQETSSAAGNGYFVRRFSRISSGKMCQTDDTTAREIWVIPTKSAYSPGIAFRYSSSDSVYAESVFGQILSTFKFLAESTPSSLSKTYTIPNNWKSVSCNDLDVSFRLPANWEKYSDRSCAVRYFRDSAFAPDRFYLERVADQGGSRREEYINRFIDYPDVKDQLYANSAVTEMNINGISVLLITPKDPTTHGPSPALVFVHGDWLYFMQLTRGEGGKPDFWNESAYMKVYYQIFSSFKFM